MARRWLHLLLSAFSLIPMTSRVLFAAAAKSPSPKQLWIVRHGQAMHNPRAEKAKEAGCSHDEFLELMRQDDAMDADLTELGLKQATTVGQNWSQLQLVVSSPLSRALQTADLVAPPASGVKRVSVEHFREINGWLLNAKRRHVDELKVKFPDWDFGHLTPSDTLWTDKLETEKATAERGYLGLCELMTRPEERILLACHGGILRFTMQQHPLVKLIDARSTKGDRPCDARFDNCEIRRYQLDWAQGEDPKPAITLTEVDLN